MDSISGDELRGHLDTLVLSLLDQAEGHGYEILRRIEAQGCGVLRMKEGSLYPVLYRLEEAGYIEGRWEDDGSSRRGPRRRIYRLTRKGGGHLGKRRTAWRQFVNVLGPIVEGST